MGLHRNVRMWASTKTELKAILKTSGYAGIIEGFPPLSNGFYVYLSDINWYDIQESVKEHAEKYPKHVIEIQVDDTAQGDGCYWTINIYKGHVRIFEPDDPIPEPFTSKEMEEWVSAGCREMYTLWDIMVRESHNPGVYEYQIITKSGLNTNVRFKFSRHTHTLVMFTKDRESLMGEPSYEAIQNRFVEIPRNLN